eukprot:TRINITY_DN611_c0_g1_i4.p1 TRINITY_DN611_c0_g1~~TRINITY_DN611_c0_g1_i4.p1  ORF type:complete len:216 (-),score=23.02 TRINITY_DN611_c0_g1_i4:140-787(-)
MAYASTESRLLQAVIKRHPSVPEQFVDELLRVLHVPNFDLGRLAPSAYLLRRVQGAELPDVPRHEAELQTLGGAKVFFHRPLDVMQHLLNTADPADLQWTFDANNGTIAYPWNSELWRKAEVEFDGYLRAGLRLLLLMMFADAYQQQSKRKAKLTGLYVGAANDRQVREPCFHSSFSPVFVRCRVESCVLGEHQLVPVTKLSASLELFFCCVESW